MGICIIEYGCTSNRPEACLGKAWLDDARTPRLMTSLNMLIEFGDPFDFTGGASTGGVGRLDFVAPCFRLRPSVRRERTSEPELLSCHRLRVPLHMRQQTSQ
jgi:hypothetical protein